MPYFHNDEVNLLLIHIPKTGGTSLEVYFSKKYNIELNNDSLFSYITNPDILNSVKHTNTSMQHLKYKTILKHKNLFKIDMNNIQIITIVRNPYERIISDLFFNNRINKKTSKKQVYEIILDYLDKDPVVLDNHNLPQYVFLVDKKKKLYPNIKILHTETLNKDMADLGYTDFNITKNKNKTNVNYYDYLDGYSINIINNYYNMDFELFGYTKIKPVY